jgi:hypothetical protein
MVLTVALGLVMLAGLLRAGRSLPARVWVHLALAVLSLAGWTAYVAREDPPGWHAWLVFAVVVGANTLGDQLMLQGWRARAARLGGPVPTGARAYLSAARDTLSFARPTAALHALLAAATFFTVLLVALGVGA